MSSSGAGTGGVQELAQALRELAHRLYALADLQHDDVSRLVGLLDSADRLVALVQQESAAQAVRRAAPRP